MKTNQANLNLIQNSTKVNLGDLIYDNGQVSRIKIYLAHFNIFPNQITQEGIDCKKAFSWLMKEFSSQIKKTYNRTDYKNDYKNTHTYFAYDFCFLYEDLMISFDYGTSKVRFLYSQTAFSKIDLILQQIRRFKKNEKSISQIYLVVSTEYGTKLERMTVQKQKQNISENYNNDFLEINDIIIKRLSRKNDKGLVILHGKPGTGKTSYIRHLISKVKKDIIFIPPNMASAITNPDFLSLLIQRPNSILIIEDAENIVIDRERSGHSPVSAILNLSDGLLSDCLNVQIICSFNTDLSKVDNALLRKGRLIARYEFKKLEVTKAQALSNKLGFNTIINHPMTLTDIYHQNEMEFEQKNEKQLIGFRN